MPVYGVLRTIRRVCRKRVTWSTLRGPCRFEPNHAGPCKPGKRR